LRKGKASITEMCSGSEAGSYLRLIDFVYMDCAAEDDQGGHTGRRNGFM